MLQLLQKDNSDKMLQFLQKSSFYIIRIYFVAIMSQFNVLKYRDFDPILERHSPLTRALGQASRARAEVFNSQTRLCLEHKRNTEHLTQTFLLLLIPVMFRLQSPLYKGSAERYTDLCTALYKAICKYRYVFFYACTF